MSCKTPHKHIGFLIRCLDNAIKNEINKELEKYDITIAQHEVLAYLYHLEAQGPICQKDLEQYLMLSNPTVTGIVKRLELKAMLNRYPSKEDGRYKCLVLTDKGRDLIKEILNIAPARIERDLNKEFTHEEHEQLIRLLEKALSGINSCQNKT